MLFYYFPNIVQTKYYYNLVSALHLFFTIHFRKKSENKTNVVKFLADFLVRSPMDPSLLTESNIAFYSLTYCVDYVMLLLTYDGIKPRI